MVLLEAGRRCADGIGPGGPACKKNLLDGRILAAQEETHTMVPESKKWSLLGGDPPRWLLVSLVLLVGGVAIDGFLIVKSPPPGPSAADKRLDACVKHGGHLVWQSDLHLIGTVWYDLGENVCEPAAKSSPRH